MGLADARAMHPETRVVQADPDGDLHVLEALALACERYTPLIGLHPPNGLILDITGCAHLFGGEAELRRDLLRRLGARGFEARAAIAGTVGSAWALARYGNRSSLPCGAEREALSTLPTAALRLAPDVVEALATVGLKRVQDILACPRSPLTARFGANLLRRLDQALGEEEEAISPLRPVPSYVAEQRFADPIGREEDVLGIIEQLACQLARLMERQEEGARVFQASLFRVDGHVRHLRISTSRPTRDAKLARRLFAERLATLSDYDPGFGFDLIRLSALRTEALAPRQERLDEPDHDVELTRLVDQFGTRFGPGSVLWLVPQNRHIPEFAVTAIPVQRGGDETWKALPAFEQDSLAPIRPIRLLERPEPVTVLAEVPEGPPLRFRWRHVTHDVARIEGPERIAAEWWRGENKPTLTRDYFRVETRQGVRVWLYRDGIFERETDDQPRWFVHGLFA